MAVQKISDTLFLFTGNDLENIKEAKEAFRDAVKEAREDYNKRTQKLAKAYFTQIAPLVEMDIAELDDDSAPAIRIDDEYEEKGYIVAELVEKAKEQPSE
jgi:TRAP-type C4-dicarboxylate transport system substrate-binding protein